MRIVLPAGHNSVLWSVLYTSVHLGRCGVPTYLKDLLHLALDLLLLGTLVWQAAHQLVYGSHNVSHFLPRNEAIAIDVVQREGPTQFLLHRATRQYRKSLNKILWQMTEKPHINKH